MIFILWLLTILLLMAIIAITAARLIARPLPPLAAGCISVISPFVFQYMMTAASLAFVALGTRPPAILFYMLFAIYGLSMWMLWPYFRRRTPITGTPALKILQANVLVKNNDAQAMQRLIKREEPDIIVACEVNAAFAQLFRSLLPTYPHQHIIESDTTSFGMAVLSRIPLDNVDVRYLSDSSIPSIFAMVTHQERRIQLVSLHAENPLRRADVRDREFDQLAAWVASANPEYLIVAGDLNATPVCPPLHHFMNRTKLKNARLHLGLAGTFPAWTMVAPLQIPIDHVLVSAGFRVHTHETVDSIGSDHLPTITTLSLKTSGF